MNRLLYTVILLAWTSGMFSESEAQKCKPTDQFDCVGDEVECNNKSQCVCKDLYHGRPELGCHKWTARTCLIFSDPHGKTLGDEPKGGIDIPVPCKYLMAHVCTGGYNYKCEAKFFTAEERGRGKFFVSHFEVVLSYEYPQGEFSFRVYLNRTDGDTTYVLQTRPDDAGPYENGVNLTKIIDELSGAVVFEYNQTEDRVRLYVHNCGIDAWFRGADLDLGKNQVKMPGVSIGVDEDYFTTEYKSLDVAFCLTSDKDVLSVGDAANILGLREDNAFIYRALVGKVPQDFPLIANGQCENVSVIAQNCTDKDDRRLAFEMCDFIWDKAHFVNCYSSEPDSKFLIDLFGQCMDSFCQLSNAGCNATKELIEDNGCLQKSSLEFKGFNCQLSLS